MSTKNVLEIMVLKRKKICKLYICVNKLCCIVAGPSHTAGQPWFSSFVDSYLLGIFWVYELCNILVH